MHSVEFGIHLKWEHVAVSRLSHLPRLPPLKTQDQHDDENAKKSSSSESGRNADDLGLR